MQSALRFLVVLGLGYVALQGCNPVNKLSRSPLIADRDTAAFRYYGEEKYSSASLLFEVLMDAYRNTPRAELIHFYYAQSLMKAQDYILAAEYFQQFVEKYNNSPLVQEALYNVGQCQFLQTNVYDLDQASSVKAIETFQLFVSIYPDAPQVPKVNERVAELRDRLAHKAYNSAELYMNIGHYKAAVVASQNVIAEFPDSKYREQAQLVLFKSQVQYAENSIPARQRERFEEAIKYYNQFIRRFPKSELLPEVTDLHEGVQKQLSRLAS
jgi:outer membrane protein assembly factor BamD